MYLSTPKTHTWESIVYGNSNNGKMPLNPNPSSVTGGNAHTEITEDKQPLSELPGIP
jgi:hypothetical protein